MLKCDTIPARQCQHPVLKCVTTSQSLLIRGANRAQQRPKAVSHLLRAKATEQETEHSQGSPEPAVPAPEQPGRRGLLAGTAVLLGTGGFLATRTGKSTPSFASLEKGSIDLDTALANGKPTIIEFYAAWCGICRELLPISAEVQSMFKKNINFVALNIDNTKWTDEVSQYRVRGVPHFVFLDGQGRQLAAAVGRVPQQVLEDNAKALAAGGKMPYAKSSGRTSTPDDASGTALKQVMPRDHA